MKETGQIIDMLKATAQSKSREEQAEENRASKEAMKEAELRTKLEIEEGKLDLADKKEYVKNENVVFQHMSKNPSNDYLNNFVSLINSPDQIYFHKFYKGYYQNNTSKRYINYRKSKGSDYTQLWENRQIYQ